jgi:hypothetical protein
MTVPLVARARRTNRAVALLMQKQHLRNFYRFVSIFTFADFLHAIF